MDYAKIVTLEEFSKIRKTIDLGRIVATSGGFDPIHPGHASCLIESKKLGDTLVVIVNGDGFLRNKKGKAFQDLETRCLLFMSQTIDDLNKERKGLGEPPISLAHDERYYFYSKPFIVL